MASVVSLRNQNHENETRGNRRLPININPWRIVALLSLTALLIGIFVSILDHGDVEQRGFISYWAARHQIIRGADPYDGATTREMEHKAGYDQGYRLIMGNTPVALFLVAPLGLVAPNTGLCFWMIALLASLVASIQMLWILNRHRLDRLHLLGYCIALCSVGSQRTAFPPCVPLSARVMPRNDVEIPI
jgi:hypothetical protein